MNQLFLPAAEPVDIALRGFARAHPGLVTLHEDPLHVTAVHRHPDRRVGLVSGGGSGHEPLHAGFVGRGMLDAAAPGRIFASPHNRQVYEASRHAAGPDGVLHVVKNYTGDRINFGIAAERLRADGIPVRRVLVDDDLATESDETATGRRGTGATAVVEKLLGGAADSGLGIDELAALGAEFVAASRSVAVAGRAQTSPARGGTAFELAPGDVEYGVGIHGERAQVTVPRPSFDDLVERMTGQVLDALPATNDDGVILFVNGLGATTLLELYAVHETVAGLLDKRGATVAGRLVGSYVPALDMSGFSVTVTALRPGWLTWWDAPSHTPAFPRQELPR
ncbi:PTS-dependent dihydroxyacetone kinase, dihydroxyacetone-binding subunit DhaK [Streptomyces sp. YIM 130001]|uniref:dihydroxyacetone kinase subunit DhaK n=1 Tax=Streptomyces sp. YIM 130001 TaxID=2259644 RepID=UPI000E6471A9|nr:dihydroxyacetone kinase subunit DhaK [Streptomyces sp. YIM 130001]RII11798.1 PTS-dependent dihydroxyacetone kinase, dihydroxyacetone-binding subunit DhaK [Streptomyces sp. YIM 130001]